MSDLPDDDMVEPDRPITPDQPVLDPPIKEELSDKVREDVDLPFDETHGDEGLDDAPFTGPARNGLIGLGGSAGGAFGRGRGSDRDTTTGVTAGTETAVEDALKWLAAHQSPGGQWEAAGFTRWCDGRPAAGGPDGAGKAHYDVGVTGLALCAFLGAGYTNRGRHPFAKTVSRGLRYLKNVQDAEGCFGPRATQHYIYNHATASLAMVEAYGMTGSPLFRGSAQKALDFIALARNPYFAWRYGVKPGDNDTSRQRVDDDGAEEREAGQRGRRPPGQAAAARHRRGGVRRHPGLDRQDDRPRHGPDRLHPARRGSPRARRR